MNESYAEVVRGIPMFKGYTAHGAQRLLEAGEILEHSPGEVLIQQGDPPTFVLVVLRGRLEIFVESQGHDLVLTEAAPGAILGELAVLGGIRRSASVRVLEPCTVLKWSDQAFRSLLLEDRHLSEEVFAASVRMLIEKEQALIAALIRAQRGTAATEGAGRTGLDDDDAGAAPP